MLTMFHVSGEVFDQSTKHLEEFVVKGVIATQPMFYASLLLPWHALCQSGHKQFKQSPSASTSL